MDNFSLFCSIFVLLNQSLLGESTYHVVNELLDFLPELPNINFGLGDNIRWTQANKTANAMRQSYNVPQAPRDPQYFRGSANIEPNKQHGNNIRQAPRLIKYIPIIDWYHKDKNSYFSFDKDGRLYKTVESNKNGQKFNNSNTIFKQNDNFRNDRRVSFERIPKPQNFYNSRQHNISNANRRFNSNQGSSKTNQLSVKQNQVKFRQQNQTHNNSNQLHRNNVNTGNGTNKQISKTLDQVNDNDDGMDNIVDLDLDDLKSLNEPHSSNVAGTVKRNNSN